MRSDVEEQMGPRAARDGGSPGGGRAGKEPVAAGSVPDFSLSLERRDGTAVIVLGGEVDLYCVPEIEAALAEAVGDGAGREGKPGRLVVDLSSVTFLDSTMLGLLLAASRREQARGAELRILVGPETPMTAFVVTGVDRLLDISRVEASDGNGTEPQQALPG